MIASRHNLYFKVSPYLVLRMVAIISICAVLVVPKIAYPDWPLVSGLVRDADGRPLADATVYMRNLDDLDLGIEGEPIVAKTDQDGFFVFEDVDEGRYSIFAGLGYSIPCFSVGFDEQITDIVIKPVEDPLHTLRAEIRCFVDHEPLSDINLRLLPGPCTPVPSSSVVLDYARNLRSDEHGRVDFPGLFPGEYRIVVVIDGGKSGQANITISGDGEIDAEHWPYEVDDRMVVRLWIDGHEASAVEITVPSLVPMEGKYEP